MAFLFLASFCLASIQSSYNGVVGSVGSEVVTKRQVILNQAIESIVFSKTKRVLKPAQLQKNLIESTESVLIEKAVEKEAKAFNVESVKKAEVEAKTKVFVSALRRQKGLLTFEFTANEVKAIVKGKLASKAFIKFKRETTVVLVDDNEARRYFEANRSRFGRLPFERFSDNIKKYLQQKKSGERFQSWFDILRRKYKIRNIVAENR